MLVGTSSREPSASSTLAWEDVSAGGVVTSDLQGGDVVAVTMAVFSGEDCLDLQLDVSAIAWVRRLSTSVAKLHLGSGKTCVEWFSGWWRPCQYQSLCVQFPFEWDVNLQIGVLVSNNAFTTAQWFWQSGYNGFVMSIQTGGIDHLGAGREELVNIELADLPPGGFLCLSLGQDAQVFALWEWCMIRTLIQLC